MALKAVLFDVDGTLADTESLGHLPSYNAAFDEIEASWRWEADFYRDELLLLPGGRERLRYYVDHHQPDLGDDRQRYDAAPDEWVNDVHARKSRHFRQRLQEGKVPMRPGVARLIAECRDAGLRLAIVSNASRRTLDPVLEYTLGELRTAFDAVVSGEQVNNKKPAPDLYLAALESLQVGADETVAIEDSRMGLDAAVSAGITTVITTNDDTVGHSFPGAALVVSGLGEADDPECIDLARLRGLIDG